MSTVKTRLGFDEQAFRELCHHHQANLNCELKAIVDQLYDCLDVMVAEISKTLYQSQSAAFKHYDDKLVEIRKTAVQAESVEHCIRNFSSMVQQAYDHAFLGLHK